MREVRPVTTGAAHGAGRLVLDAAARKIAGVRAEEGEIEKSLAQEMASAAVSQGGTGRATIGPRTADPSGPGGGEGQRPSDTLHPRVQDRRRSLEAYLAAYLEDTDIYTWLGINAASLLARAARDGIQLPLGAPRAAALADDILRTVDSAPVPNTWTEVTACEAAIALGRYDEAVERAEAFIATTPEMFPVAAFLRQLQKVWQLDTTTSPGDDLLPVLRSALLTVNGGQVTVASTDLRATPRRRVRRTAGGDPRPRPIPIAEPVPHGAEALPGGGPHPDRRRAGCRHRVPRRRPRPAPGPTPLVVVTNGHVVPEDLDPGHAHVAFHGLDEDPGRQARFRVAQQWWYQPSADRGLDTTILELDGYPQDVVPTPLAKGLPPGRSVTGGRT